MARRNQSPDGGNARTNGRLQSFCLAAQGARTVELVGDITHFQEQPIPMEKVSDGAWRTEIALAPGEHHRRFRVDGAWRDDPECRTLGPKPFGTQDAVHGVARSAPLKFLKGMN